MMMPRTRAQAGRPPAKKKKKAKKAASAARPRINRAGSGAQALAGYEYQVDVSVWAALDLVLAKKLASSVELEPTSQEDIEASLAATNPGTVAVGIATPHRKLVIQAKQRSTASWDLKSIAALLKHGGTSRVSAKDRLQDPSVHYLLVTSAPLTGVASGLRIRQFGQEGDVRGMPASLKKELHPGSEGRVAVLANEEADRIEQRIKDLLMDAFRVPHSKWKSCLNTLRQEARSKMTGRSTRIWARSELEATVRAFDGYFATSPELDNYVRPTNWQILCDRLESAHAVVIAGRSGTGKTMASAALWNHIRSKIPGIERIPIQSGPSQIRTTERSGPVLFDIEDPWGRYRFDPDSEEWNDKLPNFLHAARSDRLFVVTTRDDVLADADAVRKTLPWRVPLEAEHYRNTERRQLYDNRIASLRRDLQALAVDERGRVLKELETPLEIQKFFDALAIVTDADAKRGPEKISYAIAQSHRDSIEDTVANQVKARGASHWAAIIWGLLKANPKLSRELMPEIQDRLSDRELRYESGFEELINFLVAGRSLRQVDSAISYYHPRVEAALERIVLADPIPSRKTLGYLCDVLISFDGTGTSDWGRHAAAHLIAACEGLENLRFQPSPDARKVIDAWLVGKLSNPSSEFAELLRLAARAGSDQCMPAELARFLMERALQSSVFSKRYAPIDQPAEWYAKVSADPAVRQICDAFVRGVLPYGPRDYPADLPDHLIRLAGDLTPAFVEAGLKIVKHGVNMNSDAVANGALINLDAFAPVVTAALDFWVSLEGDTESSDTWLKIKNGEYSGDYAEHLSETAGEDGYTADELLKAYVTRLRSERGWTAVRDHPERPRLLRWWLDIVRREEAEPKPNMAEVQEVLRDAFGSGREEWLWETLIVYWHADFGGALVKRILRGHLDADVRAEAAACLALKAPELFDQIRSTLLNAGNTTRLVGIFDDLSRAATARSYRGKGFISQSSKWAQELDAAHRGMVNVFEKPERERDWTLPAESIDLARALAPVDEQLRLIKIRFGAANGFGVDDEIEAVLAQTQDVDVATAAIDVAIATQRFGIVDRGLQHVLGVVRARSLESVAARTAGTLPSELLRMAQDKSRYVRESLVRVLSNRLIPAYVDALLVLASDTWSDWTGIPGRGNADYPIAQAAADCLVNIPALPSDKAQATIERAKVCQDFKARTALFQAVASNASESDRENVLRIVRSPGRTDVRTGAALALWHAADQGKTEFVSKIEAQDLIRLPSDLSGILTLMVGRHGDDAAVEAAIGLFAGTSTRKAFLLLLAYAASDRGAEVLRRIRAPLPDGHMARALLAGTINRPLPRSAVDDLGDVPTNRTVYWLLAEHFEPEPKR